MASVKCSAMRYAIKIFYNNVDRNRWRLPVRTFIGRPIFRVETTIRSFRIVVIVQCTNGNSFRAQWQQHKARNTISAQMTKQFFLLHATSYQFWRRCATIRLSAILAPNMHVKRQLHNVQCTYTSIQFDTFVAFTDRLFDFDSDFVLFLSACVFNFSRSLK